MDIDDLHDEILDAMAAAGLAPSWEHPGCAVIDYIDGETLTRRQVWTGLHGYEYGSVSVLVDGDWVPDVEPADPDLSEDERDPAVIAAAWRRWVDQRALKLDVPAALRDAVHHATRAWVALDDEREGDFKENLAKLATIANALHVFAERM